MDLILLVIVLISVLGCQFRRKDFGNCVSPAQTSAINGIFVMLVFMRHFSQYIILEKYDMHFHTFDFFMGQLIVTPFLFFSGYGIMYSIINKKDYIRTMPKRILKILLLFDIAILIYIIVNLALDIHNSISNIFLSFIAWSSLGNSNWYIFAIIYLYLFSFIAGLLFKKNVTYIALFISISGVLYILITRHYGKSLFWYNTIFCYPAGMFFAVYFKKINSFITAKKINRYICLFSSTFLFLIFYNLSQRIYSQNIQLLLYESAAILFVLVIISFTTIISISNPILNWLGTYLFEIYILQRLPMMLFENQFANKYIYFTICLAITIIISIVFKYIEKPLNKAINSI